MSWWLQCYEHIDGMVGISITSKQSGFFPFSWNNCDPPKAKAEPKAKPKKKTATAELCARGRVGAAAIGHEQALLLTRSVRRTFMMALR